MIGPGVDEGNGTVGDKVEVGGTGLGVSVAVSLGMGETVGNNVLVGAGVWAAHATRNTAHTMRKVRRIKFVAPMHAYIFATS